jgi:hypothetical protein
MLISFFYAIIAFEVSFRRCVMKKYIMVIAMLVGMMSPLMGQEVHKSGKVEVPDLGPSAYKLVTFKMTTEKGQIGDPMTLRFKDSHGNVLFETNLGNKETQTTKIKMAVKLTDLNNTEMVTVIPELVIGDEVVVPEKPLHVPAGMLERMMKLKQSGATSSGKAEN